MPQLGQELRGQIIEFLDGRYLVVLLNGDVIAAASGFELDFAARPYSQLCDALTALRDDPSSALRSIAI
jgi:hypothetical protein